MHTEPRFSITADGFRGDVRDAVGIIRTILNYGWSTSDGGEHFLEWLKSAAIGEEAEIATNRHEFKIVRLS
ncbi:hypothetical protein [Lacunimicrobium album]